MVGMLQIITYLLCVYLVFKAIEIFQTAFMSARENRTAGIIIGILLIVAAILIGFKFVDWIDTQAMHASQ